MRSTPRRCLGVIVGEKALKVMKERHLPLDDIVAVCFRVRNRQNENKKEKKAPRMQLENKYQNLFHPPWFGWRWKPSNQRWQVNYRSRRTNFPLIVLARA